MDVIARIKDNVKMLRDTGSANNILFATGLEKCILNFIDCETKSFSAVNNKEGKFDENKNKANIKNVVEVATKISEKVSDTNLSVTKNIDIFNSRDDGFDQWAEFEDKSDEKDFMGNMHSSNIDFLLLQRLLRLTMAEEDLALVKIFISK